MLARFIFIVIALFWVTMNVLLWRAEYGAHPVGGGAVPAEMVWQKILDAPDDSSLNVVQHGKRIGLLHWQTSVGEEFSKLDEAPQAGITVKSKIHLDGNVTLPELGGRFRFECNLSLPNSRDWETLDLRLAHRPVVVEIHSVAAEQTVRLRASDGEGFFERKFKFSQLQNPMTLLGEIAGPLTGGLFAGLDIPVPAQPSANSPPAFKWEASNGTLKIGHEPVRVYRLQTRVMDRFDVVVFVSRAGEILRVELPDGIVLQHDKLSSY